MERFHDLRFLDLRVLEDRRPVENDSPALIDQRLAELRVADRPGELQLLDPVDEDVGRLQ